MRNLNRIRSNGSEQLEARELLSGSKIAGAQAGAMGGFGGSKGGFGGSKGSGLFSNGSSSTSSENSSSSGSSYSSSSYDESSYSSNSYSGRSYSGGGSSCSFHRFGFNRGFSRGYRAGFADGLSFAGGNGGSSAEVPNDLCPPPEVPEECQTPAPEPTPPAPPVDECPPAPTPEPEPPTPGPSEDFSRGYFNGNEYQLLKQNGTKYTYKNYNLQGGSRTIDYNTITGTFKMHSPIAFDLNGTGKIETTGVSTAKTRIGSDPVGNTVSFDINGDGTKENIEWMSGSGDGLLVDNRDGNAATSMDGNRLFGNTGGFANGYDKLANLDRNGDGKLTGVETKGLQVWVDNGNAKVDAGELKSLREFKINQISVRSRNVTNSRGESLMQSTAGQGSNQVLSEDVWFAQAPVSA